MFILDALIAAVPWWVWLAAGVVVLASVHRLVGWKGIVAGASALLAVLLHKRGQSVGESRILKKANRDADKAIKRANEVRARSNANNADPERMRDNDGYRRDT